MLTQQSDMKATTGQPATIDAQPRGAIAVLRESIDDAIFGRELEQGERKLPTINPYINFNGNAEEAFNFYKSVFGGEFQTILRFKDVQSPEMPVSANEADKIMRIVLPIGGNTLIANDVPESMGRVNEQENRSKIAVSTQDRAEADRIFAGLSQGGTLEMPLGESPWGTYFAMFRDKYGIEWTVESNGAATKQRRRFKSRINPS